MSGEVQAVVRAASLLELLREEGPRGVSELSVRLELPLGTVHRLARTLVTLGFVHQLDDRRYALGSRLVPLGIAASGVLGARARPVLADLAGTLEESANLAALNGASAQYVAQVAGPHSMRMFTEVGRMVPLHATGVGKAMLATMGDARAFALIEEHGMDAVTPYTIVDKERMRDELTAVRELGYAVDDDEMEVGVRCIAVAFQGATRMAVSVSGPSSRFTERVVRECAPIVRAAARRLETAFANRGAPDR